MFSSASSLVFPWLTHPGIEGHSTTNTPSSSRSIVTLKIMNDLLLHSSPNASQNLPEISSLPIESATPRHRPADRTICLRCCHTDRAGAVHLPVVHRRLQCA